MLGAEGDGDPVTSTEQQQVVVESPKEAVSETQQYTVT